MTFSLRTRHDIIVCSVSGLIDRYGPAFSQEGREALGVAPSSEREVSRLSG